MTCRTFKKQADAWLAGQVSADVAEAMSAHAAICEDCAATARFHHRMALELSGEATLDGAMRYRLATELNAVDEKPARSVWKEGFGEQIMRKAVWPVTAVVVAFATYSVVAPNGVAAVTLRNKLNSAKESVHGSDLNLNVKEHRPIDDVLVRQVAASQLSEEEREFMRSFKVTVDVRNENGKETNLLTVDYDHSKFDKSPGDKPGVSYLTSKAHPNLRAIVRSGPGTEGFDVLSFQRKKGDKWETIDIQDMKKIEIMNDVAKVGDGMELDLKGLDNLGAVIADSLDSIDLTAVTADGETLGQNKKLTEEQKKQIQESMEKAKVEIEKARDEIRKQLSSKDLGSGSELTDDQRKQVQMALEKAQEALNKVQEAMGPKMLKLMQSIEIADGKTLTKEQQEKLKKEMAGVAVTIDKAKIKAALAEVNSKTMAIALKNAELAKVKAVDGKAMSIEIQKAMQGELAGGTLDKASLKALPLKGTVLKLDGNSASLKFGDKDSLDFSKKDDKWVIDYDHDKWRETPGPSSTVTVLVSKSDANKRVVITRASDGSPSKVTVQQMKGGDWKTNQSFVINLKG